MFTYYVEKAPKAYSRIYNFFKKKTTEKDKELEAVWQDCFNNGKHYIYNGDCTRETDKAFIKPSKKGGFLLCLK